MSNVQTISQRLDNLPIRGLLGVSGYYWGLLLKTGFGWAMDSMDTFLFTYLGSKGWKTDVRNSDDSKLNAHEIGLLGSAAFAGSLVGGIFFGYLADVYGRKPVFMATLVIFMIATLVNGAAQSYAVFLAFRFIAGIGMGGELPVASTLVQELVPSAVRGRIIVLLESFWSIGCMVAVLLAMELTKAVSWRVVFYISAIPAFYAIAIRYIVPESPKWLASVGRMDEAEAIVAKIEQAHGVTYDKDAEKPVVAQNAAGMDTFDCSSLWFFERMAILFRGEFTVRTIVLWTVWICLSFSYYAVYIWLPVLRGNEKGGFNLNESTGTMIFIVFWQLPGYLSAAYIVEILGRKVTLASYLVCAVASALAFGYVENTKTNLMITGACMSWFMLGAWGSLYAYTPENYPTSVRAMGASYASSFSRIGATAGPYVIPIMQEANCSSIAIMWVCSAVLLFGVIVLIVFGFEPRGQNVESAPKVEAYLSKRLGHNELVETPRNDNA